MWPNLSGVEGIFPLGGLATCATAGPIAGTEVAAAAPTVIPRLFRKFLRFSCCCVMDRPPFGGSGANAPATLGARTSCLCVAYFNILGPRCLRVKLTSADSERNRLSIRVCGQGRANPARCSYIRRLIAGRPPCGSSPAQHGLQVAASPQHKRARSLRPDEGSVVDVPGRPQSIGLALL